MLNYPYGYTLRTTLFDTIEFAPKKGYRHVTQTINPKNGKLNAPKKSTYYPFIIRYYNEDGHIKTKHLNFNYSVEERNNACDFIAENFDLFTPEEINYFYKEINSAFLIEIKSLVVYCGANFDEMKPYFDPFIKLATSALKDGLNHFSDLKMDVEQINKFKVPDYNPFTIKTCKIG